MYANIRSLVMIVLRFSNEGVTITVLQGGYLCMRFAMNDIRYRGSNL